MSPSGFRTTWAVRTAPPRGPAVSGPRHTVSLARNNAEQTTAYRHSGNEIVRKLQAGSFLHSEFRLDQKMPDKAYFRKPGLMFNHFDPF